MKPRGPKRSMEPDAQLLDAVALLQDMPAASLVRGQVGTIVEVLDERTVLVEFADRDGRAYAIAPIPLDQLLHLHHGPTK